jgi:hypothetical protein
LQTDASFLTFSAHLGHFFASDDTKTIRSESGPSKIPTRTASAGFSPLCNPMASPIRPNRIHNKITITLSPLFDFPKVIIITTYYHVKFRSVSPFIGKANLSPCNAGVTDFAKTRLLRTNGAKKETKGKTEIIRVEPGQQVAPGSRKESAGGLDLEIPRRSQDFILISLSPQHPPWSKQEEKKESVGGLKP